MPTSTWDQVTIDGKDYLVVDTAQFRIPLDFDPSSNMFIAVAAPSGGLGSFPALVQGDPGLPPTFDTPTLHPLAYGDTTADSVAFTLVTPATATAGPVYHADFWLHTGAPGPAGANTVLGSTDLAGTPVAGQMIVVNPAANGCVFQPQKVGDRYIPAAILATPSGNPAYTLCQVSIPAQPFDWRPQVSGQCVITGAGTGGGGGSDVQVDLVARLNDAAAGNIVGRAIGSPELSATSHIHPTQVLVSGPPTGSADGYDKVLSGAAATVYLRAERQNGSDSFTTSPATTRFQVRVCPIP